MFQKLIQDIAGNLPSYMESSCIKGHPSAMAGLISKRQYRLSEK